MVLFNFQKRNYDSSNGDVVSVKTLRFLCFRKVFKCWVIISAMLDGSMYIMSFAVLLETCYHFESLVPVSGNI